MQEVSTEKSLYDTQASSGAAAVSMCMLQIPGISIRTQFQFVARSIFVKHEADESVTVAARLVLVEALESVAHRPIGSNVWPE
ncbi:hypothetical protein KIN20_020570 [Parelaphostrongylus tenuis]|uniref:Uncharacterized protein n=1 Tax=Parelaphostrongylus tenuis TaxID=148309 RepID=A0AAD5MMM9_PARTN|nr:hypothetical protein KIN20_020570 [Parelaphostrongylus tenuis]